MSDLILRDCRLSFPHLHTPQVNTNDDGTSTIRYNGLFIIPDGAQVEEVRKAIKAAALAKWGAQAESKLKAVMASNKTFLHPCEEKEYDGFDDGLFYISASSRSKPIIMDRAKNDLSESSGLPYAGCYVNVKIRPWVQDNKFGKRINAEVRVVQFVKDGDAFAGGAPASRDEADDMDSLETSNDDII